LGDGTLDDDVVHPRHAPEALDRSIQLHLDRGTGEVAQLGEGAALHDPPRPDDADPVAECLHLRENVAGEEHGTAVV